MKIIELYLRILNPNNLNLEDPLTNSKWLSVP